MVHHFMEHIRKQCSERWRDFPGPVACLPELGSTKPVQYASVLFSLSAFCWVHPVLGLGWGTRKTITGAPLMLGGGHGSRLATSCKFMASFCLGRGLELGELISLS